MKKNFEKKNVEKKESNVLAFGSDGKTASEYKHLDCLGTYDTLSEIGKRKREFVCRQAEFKLRTCTCEVISHLYCKKVDVAERGKEVQRAKAPVGGLGGRAPPPPPPPPLRVQGRGPFRGVSLPLVAIQ